MHQKKSGLQALDNLEKKNYLFLQKNFEVFQQSKLFLGTFSTNLDLFQLNLICLPRPFILMPIGSLAKIGIDSVKLRRCLFHPDTNELVHSNPL